VSHHQSALVTCLRFRYVTPSVWSWLRWRNSSKPIISESAESHHRHLQLLAHITTERPTDPAAASFSRLVSLKGCVFCAHFSLWMDVNAANPRDIRSMCYRRDETERVLYCHHVCTTMERVLWKRNSDFTPERTAARLHRHMAMPQTSATREPQLRHV
jgi:hypothetical protein